MDLRATIAAMILSLVALTCMGVASAEDKNSAALPKGQERALRVAQNQPAETPASIYRNSIHAVFTIRSAHTLGTGFTFASGLIATNAHVVGDSVTVEVEEQDGHTFQARVVRKDVDHDFAILEPEGIRPFATVVPLPKGDAPAIGDGIVVIGSPGGLKGTVTAGIVSQNYPDGVVQLNVSVNPGNSGGPVFDMQGRVFGMATFKYTKGDGIGFAIPISWLEQ
ncbi:MAG: S1C family serine protease [Dokdonella sp.]